MSRSIETIKEKVASLNNGINAYGGRDDDVSLNSKIEILKDAALTLLDELEALANARSINIRHGIKLDEEVQRFERDLIQQALERTGWHQTRAARLLGVNLTTLHYKIKRYQIRVPDLEGNSLVEASSAQQ